MKKLLCLLLLPVLFCACASAAPDNPRSGEITYAPFEYPEQRPVSVTLYQPTADHTLLTAIQRSLTVSEGSSVFEETMKELLTLPVFPESVTCRSLTQVGNILSVDLSHALRETADEETFYDCLAVLAATFTQFAGIDFVSVTVEGKPLRAGTRPVTLLSAYTGSGASLAARCRDASLPATFYGVIYQSDPGSGVLVPSVVTVTAPDGDFTDALLKRQLSEETLFSGKLMMQELLLSDSTAILHLTASGEWTREADGLDLQALALCLGGLGLSAKALTVTVTDGEAHECLRERVEPDYSCVRSRIDVFSPGPTRLKKTVMYVSRLPGEDDLARFTAEYAALLNPALREEDSVVNRVTVADRTVILDLGRVFFDAYASLSPEQEYTTVYALVATLCRYTGAREAMILENGQKRSYFTGTVVLDQPLLDLPARYLDSLT